MDSMDTQWICIQQPVCLCSGEKAGGELTGYSCDCIRDTQAPYCTDCLCTMIEIETDSGRLVGQA